MVDSPSPKGLLRADDGKRLKSVRIVESSTTMGLLIKFPNEEVERVNFRLSTISPFLSSFFLFLARRKAMTAAPTTTATAPTEAPAMTATGGPLLEFSCAGSSPIPDSSGEVLVGVAPGEEGFELGGVEGAGASTGATFWFMFLTHWFPPLQIYPNGQHVLLPQLSSVPLKAVVFITASGNCSASCSSMVHLIGLILVQSLPVGQQRTVVFAASGMQVVPEGQQKLSGREPGLH